MAFTLKAADLFCGAGGASTGLLRAAAALGITKVELLAVNHWPTAVATHELNHPGVRHLCEAVDKINPREAVPGGRLHVLLAGPECTHHSTASGGRPKNDQSRATAWHILKWAQELYIDTILIENVPEFRSWGPLGVNKKPIKRMKGQTYLAFLNALKSLGYRVEDKVVNSADFGDPTTRQRLFILAQRGRGAVAFPAATHSRTGDATLFGKRQRWRAAREVIDWTITGQSIFDRKKPLAPATMARILAGLERFGGPELAPFLVILRNHAAGRSLDQPLPALTAGGQHVGLCEPFVLGQQTGSIPRETGDPLPTISTDGAIALVEPFMVPMYGERPTQAPRTHSVSEPVPCIPATGGGKFGVVEPVLLHTTHGGRAHSVDKPVPTVTGANRGELAVAEPFLVPYHAERREGETPRVHNISEPLPTVTTENRFAIAEPYLVQTAERRRMSVDSVEEPVRTITAQGGRCFGLAEPFLTKFNGTAVGAYSVDDPLDTISTKDRFALAQPVVDGYRLDIRFRMLQPHELAAAMSFPTDYEFTGTKGDVVKQIGNAWPGQTARALCAEILMPYAARQHSTAWRKERTA